MSDAEVEILSARDVPLGLRPLRREVLGHPGDRLPAPALPNAVLTPRRNPPRA